MATRGFEGVALHNRLGVAAAAGVCACLAIVALFATVKVDIGYGADGECPPVSPPISVPVSPPTSPPISSPVSPPACPPVSPPASPPAVPPECVDVVGSGTLANGAAFTIRVQGNDRRFRGSITYRDRRTGLRFRSTEITSVTVSGDTATITGTGIANGDEVEFTVTATDSSPDRFSIRLSNGYTAASPVVRGDIRIRNTCDR